MCILNKLLMLFFHLKIESHFFKITWPCFLRFLFCPHSQMLNFFLGGYYAQSSHFLGAMSPPFLERGSCQEGRPLKRLFMTIKTFDRYLDGGSSLTLHDHR